ncbi:fimbrial protein [Escherichia coli]|nr:fimbrial protein [Escherichia coli]
MKKNTLYISVFISCIGSALADDNMNRIINFGNQSIIPQQHVSSSVPFYTQNESFQSECTEHCKSTRISWYPLSSVLNPMNTGEGYIFKSGISGISILIKPEKATQTSTQQVLFGLIKTEEGTGAGTLTNIPLMRRITEQLDENGRVINRINEDINVTGQVNRSGCLMPQGQSVNMILPPVSVAMLKSIHIGEALTSISDNSFISLNCENGTTGSLDLFFTGKYSDTPSVLPAITSSGKQSGVGFIVMSGESKAIWDGLTPINIPLTGDISQLGIPFKAYYTRLSDDFEPGALEAHGQITIKYH